MTISKAQRFKNIFPWKWIEIVIACTCIFAHFIIIIKYCLSISASNSIATLYKLNFKKLMSFQQKSRYILVFKNVPFYFRRAVVACYDWPVKFVRISSAGRSGARL